MNIAFLGNFNVDYTSETHHKKSLEALGHNVIPLQEGRANSDEVLSTALGTDMFVWVHTHGWETTGDITMVRVLQTLKERNIPTVTYHLDLWFGLERQKDLEQDEFYKHIGYFFTVDKLMADWFNENTEVKGRYLRPAMFQDEAIMLEPNQEPLNDVIFVGSRGYHHEWQYRPQLIDWLAETYGDRFKHFGGDGLGVVRGLPSLNQLYVNTKVVVGDTLCLNFDYPYYWSDRVYETLGRGGFIIHPDIKGIREEFSDCVDLRLYEYGNFKQLKYFIDYYINNDEEREKIRLQGYEKVKNNYTYKHRWQQIIDEVTK